MATYKPIRKTANGTEEIKIPYAVLADPPTIPAAVTSINGLRGGTLTSPLTLTGGDATTASKIILTANGQITDQSTSTLFGRSSGVLIVGHKSIPLRLRGSATNPVYSNDNKTFKELAFKSDIPDISGLMPKSGGTFTGNVTFSSGHINTNLIKSADDSQWIAEITGNGLEIGGSGTPLRFYSSTRPVVANQNKELAYTSDIPTFSLSGTTLTITI